MDETRAKEMLAKALAKIGAAAPKELVDFARTPVLRKAGSISSDKNVISFIKNYLKYEEEIAKVTSVTTYGENAQGFLDRYDSVYGEIPAYNEN